MVINAVLGRFENGHGGKLHTASAKRFASISNISMTAWIRSSTGRGGLMGGISDAMVGRGFWSSFVLGSLTGRPLVARSAIFYVGIVVN